MIKFFKTTQEKQAEKLSREILKLNKKIEDCKTIIQDAIIWQDVNGKISSQNRKRYLEEQRENLFTELKNIN